MTTTDLFISDLARLEKGHHEFDDGVCCSHFGLLVQGTGAAAVAGLFFFGLTTFKLNSDLDLFSLVVRQTDLFGFFGGCSGLAGSC